MIIEFNTIFCVSTIMWTDKCSIVWLHELKDKFLILIAMAFLFAYNATNKNWRKQKSCF